MYRYVVLLLRARRRVQFKNCVEERRRRRRRRRRKRERDRKNSSRSCRKTPCCSRGTAAAASSAAWGAFLFLFFSLVFIDSYVQSEKKGGNLNGIYIFIYFLIHFYFRFIELYEEAKLSAMIPLFLAHVIQFIREAELAVLHQDEDESSNKLDNNNNSEELILTLRQTCAQLVQIVTFSTHPLYMMMSEPGLMDPIDNVPPPPVNWSLARQITAKLGQVFVSIVDTFVGREIQVLTAALESGKCISAARLAANSLMSLGADAARPAMRPLIQAFQTAHLRPVWADLLRALSALCSSADIIQDFEMVCSSHFFICLLQQN